MNSTDDARTGIRWIICALLFLATTINYIDRAVLSVLKPALEKDLGWSQVDYGWMVTAFQLTYAIGYVSAGRLIDRIGVRLGFLLSVTLWSLATMAHAATRNGTGSGGSRLMDAPVTKPRILLARLAPHQYFAQ